MGILKETASTELKISSGNYDTSRKFIKKFSRNFRKVAEMVFYERSTVTQALGWFENFIQIHSDIFFPHITNDLRIDQIYWKGHDDVDTIKIPIQKDCIYTLLDAFGYLLIISVPRTPSIYFRLSEKDDIIRHGKVSED